MSTSQPRRPAGTPAGGQFAGRARPEPRYRLNVTDHDPAVVTATETLRAELGDEVADAFARREAERCGVCEGAGLVPDPESLRRHPGFPSLAEEIACPNCGGRGRIPLDEAG